MRRPNMCAPRMGAIHTAVGRRVARRGARAGCAILWLLADIAHHCHGHPVLLLCYECPVQRCRALGRLP